MKANRDDLATFDYAIGKVDKAEATITFLQRLFTDISIFLQNAASLKTLLMWFPYASVLIIALLLIVDTLALACDTTKPLATRIIKGTLAAVILAAAIATLVVAAPIAGYIITAGIAARRVWETLVATYNLMTTSSTDEKHLKELRGIIAENAHVVALSVISIVGLVLVANPLTFIAGISILLGVAAYLAFDKTGYNPVRMLGNLIFNNPFKVMKPEIEAKDKKDNEKRKVVDHSKDIPTSAVVESSFNTKTILAACKPVTETNGSKATSTRTPANDKTYKAPETFSFIGTKHLSLRKKEDNAINAGPRPGAQSF